MDSRNRNTTNLILKKLKYEIIIIIVHSYNPRIKMISIPIYSFKDSEMTASVKQYKNKIITFDV